MIYIERVNVRGNKLKICVYIYLMEQTMHVIKRSGMAEEVSIQKILNSVMGLAKLHNIALPISDVCFKISNQLFNNIETMKIDELLAEQFAALSSEHPDYGKLAGIITITNLQKRTVSTFYDAMYNLFHFKDDNNKAQPIISNELWKNIVKHRNALEAMIMHERDFNIDYFGIKTLERAYLLRINQIIVERPQYMWLRVSLAIHGENMEKVKETYDCMSVLTFTHATPTLFNAGTPKPQLSSCFLLAMKEDSISGIYESLADCAAISKWAGGIGIHCHNIRAKKSPIRGTNGESNGLVPMLKVFNETARYVDQGGGKRNGSFAVYLELWHADIFDFLDLKKNHGDENARARDLFYALWVCDDFMRRVLRKQKWYLCCPDKCPGLADVHGKEFTKLYNTYIDDKKYEKEIDARELWLAILDAQMETGTPYLLFKDAANAKSNQQNLGTIKSSNLCTEIIEFSSPEESAVCNLASIALSKCVENKEFNYEKLHMISKIVTVNLNLIIDKNYYPTKEAKRSNLLHRPIGIGVQGLADTFALMDIAFDSDLAKETNTYIFETIYHGALEASCELAMERKEVLMPIRAALDNDVLGFKDYDNPIDMVTGKWERLEEYMPLQAEMNNLEEKYLGAYSSFRNSPMYNGYFQFDLWKVAPSDRYDWKLLMKNIQENGIRNSLLLAPMPTASTSQILGNNECFEPFTNNIYSRRTLAGDFIVVNKYLMKELIDLGLWNKELKDNIIENRGSIQHITNISDHIKAKYKTAWELSMKTLINMAADRGAYICQSQSMNLWVEDPDYAKLTAMHFYSWEKGLKTGIYYLRRKPKHNAQQFTILPKEEDSCEMCGS